MLILAINPGSTSTKVALWNDGQMVESSLPWSAPKQELVEQKPERFRQIKAWLAEQNCSLGQLQAVVGRGGLLRPLAAGTYHIDAAMITDAAAGRMGQHPSNLGPILAKKFGDLAGVPSYIVDPVCIDERHELAKYTGYPPLTRDSFGHYLSMRAAAHRAARQLDKPLADCRFVLCHLGAGISVAAMGAGKILDINNANDEGPFSPERAGGLPVHAVLDLCYSPGMDEKTALDFVLKDSGLRGYLQTADLRDVEAMDSDQSREVLQALVYQLSKEVGAYAVVLQGDLDAVIVTGGMALSERLVEQITAAVQWLGPVLSYPGSDEMLALVEGVRRVLVGEEEAFVYGEGNR